MDDGLETKVAFGDMMQAFAAFREANDERLAQIEARMSADVVTSEKVDRINRAVDEAKARLDELTPKALRMWCHARRCSYWRKATPKPRPKGSSRWTLTARRCPTPWVPRPAT